MPGRAFSVLEKPAELSDHDQSLAGRVLSVLPIGTLLKLPVGGRQEPLDVPTRIEFAHAVRLASHIQGGKLNPAPRTRLDPAIPPTS